MELQAFWQTHPSAALAFSGGADSAYLLWSAVQSGADVTAYFVKTEFQPAFELEDARRLAEELGAKMKVLEQSALADPAVVANGADRCYHCKKHIFSSIARQAVSDGYTLLLDGTNASDDPDDRPGVRALEELHVLSPLRLCGLTKEEIRRRSRAAGLFTWNKPAYACLATRIPTGTAIEAAELARVEAAEGAVSALGFTDFRIRRTAEGCKLQLPEDQLSRAIRCRETLVERLRPWFAAVTLDLTPRPASTLSDEESLETDSVSELRCNLDDMTGEDIAFACEHLLECGALDVWTTPITMKKGRPAVLLTCLCRPGQEKKMAREMLRHTTTLGVRISGCERYLLHRSVEDRGGIRVKTASGGGISKEKAEFEDLAEVARKEGYSLQETRKKYGL